MSKIAVFSCGHKGGPGKSTTLLGLATIARGYGVDVATFDFDGATGSLIGYLGERTKQSVNPDGDPMRFCQGYELTNDEDAPELINITDQGYPNIIVDLPGAALKSIESSDALGELDIMDFYIEAGYEVVVLVPFTPYLESIRGVKIALDTYGEKVTVVAVRNIGLGGLGTWSMWDGDSTIPESATKGRIREIGYEIDLPKIYANTLAKIAATRFSDTSFKIERNLPSPPFPRHDLAAWSTWLRKVEEEFRKVPPLNALFDGANNVRDAAQ